MLSLRLLRLLRLLVKVDSFRMVAATFVKAAPAASKLFSTLSLIMYLFAVVGTQLFGGVITTDTSGAVISPQQARATSLYNSTRSSPLSLALHLCPPSPACPLALPSASPSHSVSLALTAPSPPRFSSHPLPFQPILSHPLASHLTPPYRSKQVRCAYPTADLLCSALFPHFTSLSPPLPSTPLPSPLLAFLPK